MVNKPLLRPYFWGGYVKGGLVDRPLFGLRPPGNVIIGLLRFISTLGELHGTKRCSDRGGECQPKTRKSCNPKDPEPSLEED